MAYRWQADLAYVMLDLDRCEHGRHSVDPCLSCPGGRSAGNPHMPVGAVIGYGVDGREIRVPAPEDRVNAGAWRAPRERASRITRNSA